MIFLGADHGGYELKEKIKKWLKDWNLKFEDMGALSLDPEDDYPEFAIAVSQKVGEADDIDKEWKDRPKGILLCRSSIGVTVAANKVKGVRAAGVHDVKSAKHARTNDDINVIAFSGDWMKESDAKEVLKVWLDTGFSRELRHARRIDQIIGYEEKTMCASDDLGNKSSGGCCGGGCC